MNHRHAATRLTRWPRPHLRSHQRAHRYRPAHSLGTATIELVLVMPLVLFMTLLLIQMMLLAVGHLMVHRAAYSATRTATIHIPMDEDRYPGEPPNQIAVGDLNSGTKFEAIQRSAAFALIPVSGNLSESSQSVSGTNYVDALREHYDAYGQALPRWGQRLVAGRVNYALQHTDVTLFETYAEDNTVSYWEIGQGFHDVEVRQAISVEVEHRFHLSMPWVRWFFEDGRHVTQSVPGIGSESAGENINTGYRNLRARYTLTNEGIVDRLPDPPPVPRIN